MDKDTRILQAVKEIENWKGDCYSSGDEVETALDDIRKAIGYERVVSFDEKVEMACHYGVVTAMEYYDLSAIELIRLEEEMEK